MKFLERKHIDTKKWDERIAQSAVENIFQYSWYLDQCAENWEALVTDNYQTVLPIPYTKKLGVKRFYPAPFTREYDIIGNEFGWNEAIAAIKNHVGQITFRNKSNQLLAAAVERKHQYLYLNENFTAAFRTNARRQIKKGHKQFQIETGANPKELIALFEEHVAHKIDSISGEDLKKLSGLMQIALKNGHGELLFAKNEAGKLVAGGFFLKDKKKITYLKGAASNEAKKQGAMYALFDFAMKRYANDYHTFDFGGSDVENVATFYKKFGAQDRIYYHYNLDQTPFWFKTLKKLKKSP